MKKFFAVIVSLLTFAGVCFAADPAEGYWISYDDKTGEATAGWKIWVENNKLCGKILSIAEADQGKKAVGKKSIEGFTKAGQVVQDLPMVGTTWLYGLSKTSEGVWKSGSIVDPNSGDKYTCEVTYHKADGGKYKVDTLEMRGKIGPFGRSQFWKTADEAKASSLKK